MAKKKKASPKIPAWASYVQRMYTQKFSVGDIVSYKNKIGVIIGSTDFNKGDNEATTGQLQPPIIAYTIWFARGPSSWYDEDDLTLLSGRATDAGSNLGSLIRDLAADDGNLCDALAVLIGHAHVMDEDEAETLINKILG